MKPLIVIDTLTLVFSLLAAAASGLGTAIVAGMHNYKKEKQRIIEREQDHLKMEIKDLKIELYKVEKELTEWKDKYYKAIEELINLKSELENALNTLSHIEMHEDLDQEYLK